MCEAYQKEQRRLKWRDNLFGLIIVALLVVVSVVAAKGAEPLPFVRMEQPFSASAVVIGASREDGIGILTCAHAVPKGGGKVYFRLYKDGAETPMKIPAHHVATHSKYNAKTNENDAAVFRIKPEDYPTDYMLPQVARLADSSIDFVEAGQTVTVVGSYASKTHAPAMREVRIHAFSPKQFTLTDLGWPGHSGGPILTTGDSPAVIGVLWGSRTDGVRRGLVTGPQVLNELMSEVMQVETNAQRSGCYNGVCRPGTKTVVRTGPFVEGNTPWGTKQTPPPPVVTQPPPEVDTSQLDDLRDKVSELKATIYQLEADLRISGVELKTANKQIESLQTKLTEAQQSEEAQQEKHKAVLLDLEQKHAQVVQELEQKQTIPEAENPPPDKPDVTTVEGVNQVVEEHKQQKQRLAEMGNLLSSLTDQLPEGTAEKVAVVQEMAEWTAMEWLAVALLVLITLFAGGVGSSKLIDKKVEKKVAAQTPPETVKKK